MFLHSVLAAEFSEHPVADPTHKDLHPFEVPILNSETNHSAEFGITEYCAALMNKMFSLAHLQIMPFFQYQCSLVNDPKTWLKTLQHLFENNLHFLQHGKHD